MAGAIKQAKGSVTRVVLGYEEPDCYNQPSEPLDREPYRMLHNSAEITAERSLNVSATIRGDRNPTEPFQGNTDVNGDIVVPVDDLFFGYWLKAAIGAPITEEAAPATGGKQTAGSTLTISGGVGTGTFSAEQGALAVGDVVIYRDVATQVIQTAIIDTVTTPDTVVELSLERDAATPAPDITAAEVIAILPNKVSAAGVTLTILADPSDITVTPSTVVVSGGTGATVFSAAQVGIAVGDIVIFETVPTDPDEPNEVRRAYVTGYTSDTSVDLSEDEAGTIPIPDTVNPGNLLQVLHFTNSPNYDGVFSAAQTGLAVGDRIIYDITGTRTELYIAEVVSDTQVRLETPKGHTIADGSFDGGPFEVDAILDVFRFKHTYKILPIADLPSMDIELGFQDLVPPVYNLYKGVKVDSMELETGGDEELVATISTIGASRDKRNTPFDAAIPASVRGSRRFQNFQATAREGQPLTASGVLRQFNLTLSNNLDTESFVIGGGGIRVALPEGIAEVGGSLEALFADEVILDKAIGVTETSFEISYDNGPSLLVMRFPEAVVSQNDPGVPGPEGVILELDFQAYKDDDAEGSALVAELFNKQPEY